eukprot:354857-Chlamydomonas_euryale.AAC.35
MAWPEAPHAPPAQTNLEPGIIMDIIPVGQARTSFPAAQRPFCPPPFSFPLAKRAFPKPSLPCTRTS